MEEPGGTANEAPPPRRGHPRGVVITSILGRAAKTPLILPIRSDLAVDADFQHAGIGTELLCETRARLGFRCSLILLSAPAAQAYYPRVGFTRHESAWLLGAEDEIRLSPDE